MMCDVRIPYWVSGIHLHSEKTYLLDETRE